MIKTILSSKVTYLILFLYAITVAWWVYINTQSLQNTTLSYWFNWFYGIIALIGAIYGLYTSLKVWGGFSSVMGKALIFLALGLLGQWFGLQVWTYYNVIARLEVPYPSLADIGYFALIPCYAIAAYLIAYASGAKFSLKTPIGKILAASIPIAALLTAYFLFIRNVGFDFSDPLRLFLDIGYPLGEIIPVSIALFTISLATGLLGGSMKSRIVFLTIAFSFQFITEYIFLYKAGLGIYNNGGFSDLMYATSYTIMSLVLISFIEYRKA